MGGRLRELRNARRILQEIAGQDLGVSQQNLSRYENDVNTIPADMLVRLAKYYNVTTDYILGISDEKRNLGIQVRLSEMMEENYEFMEIYRTLNSYEKELLWALMVEMKKLRKNGEEE